MKNIFYVTYDNDKNVIGISREFNEEDNYFPIEAYKVRDFILGTKSFASYYVRNDGFDNFTLEEKKFEKLNYIGNDIVEVQKVDQFNDLIIEHNLNKKQWKMSLSHATKECVNKDHFDRIFQFYVCQKEQNNFLVRTLECSLNDIYQEKEILFISQYEHDYNKLKIFTKKYFTKIGITNV
jgi:hypothetical protein